MIKTISVNTINTYKLAQSCCLAIILVIAWLALIQPQSAGAVSSPGLIVPLYSYPGASWDKIIQEKNVLIMVEKAQKQNEKSVYITVNTMSTGGIPINGLWTTIQSNTSHISGFTPFSYSNSSGENYLVTVSNFGNYTFDHWDDGTRNSSRLIAPSQNVTLTAYYVINKTLSANQTPSLHATKDLNVLSQYVPVHSSQSVKAQNIGTITTNILYTSGDRADYSFLSFKIYQDTNKTLYREIDSASGNPFQIDLLPLGHTYKIEVFANGMCSDIEYVDLEKTKGEVDMRLPFPGGMMPHIFYNDGYTPIADAIVNIKSQDNKTWSTGLTDLNGETLRFWLEPTSAKNNYFIIQVKIDQRMSYDYSPVFLYPGYAQDIRVTTPWPPVINNIITLKVSDTQSHLFSSTSRNLMMEVLDSSGKEIANSKVNPRGEADFGNLKVGDYMFLAISQNGKIWGSTNATLDGTKTSYTIFENGH